MKINNYIKFIFYFIIFVLILVSVYIIYGKNKSDIATVESKKKENSISYNLSIGITNFDTINPILSNSKDCQYISKLIYSSLLTFDKDFNLVPEIAKEYSKLDNACYIIKLNNNYFWHDGQALTSKDVKFTIENLKKIQNSVYYKKVEKIKDVQIIDDYTLKIFLSEQIENFEYNLCFPIVASHTYEENTLISKTEIPIGTGKFKIDTITSEEILLRNNQEKQIKLLIYPSVTKMYNSFMKGEVDLIFTENINYEEFIGKIGYESNIEEGQKIGYIIINTEKVNKEIRKALGYAINKSNLIYEIYGNKYIKCDFPINLDENLYEYNENESLKLTKNKKIILNLLVERNNEKLLESANLLKEQFKNMGISIKISEYRKEDFNYYINLNNYELILLEENLEPKTNLTDYLGEDNYSNYKNEEIMYLLKEISNINDDKLLQSKYNRILEIYKEDLPFICLYYSSNIILHSTKVKGNFEHNWYNLFYNIDKWYKIE